MTQTTPTHQDTFDRIDKIRDAQEKLIDAIELIREATAGHPTESNTKAYIVDHLTIMATSEHGFLTRDKNLDDVIRELSDAEGGCDCGEMDFCWDEETQSMRCECCGGLETPELEFAR